MEQIKWPTASIWFEETMEIFQQIVYGNEADEISRKVNSGEIFADKKEASCQTCLGSNKSKIFWTREKRRPAALAKVLQSNISLQEKQNYAYIYYIEYENLFCIFLEEYIYKNFTELSQKTYTQMDLDKFLEDILVRYKDLLPSKLQDGISDSSMAKVRNMLYKNISTFGWGTTDNSKLTVRRPSLTPEWFTFSFILFLKNRLLLNVKFILVMYLKDFYLMNMT